MGGVNNMNIRKGEIWEVEHGKDSKLALVLAFKGSYCSVLLLNDEPRESRDIQLNARGMKYTESGMVSYKFVDAFIDFVRTTTDEEFADVMSKVGESLGMSGSGEDKDLREENNNLHIMLKCSEQNSEERKRLLEDSQKHLADAIVHIEKLNSEIKILKETQETRFTDSAEVVALKAQLEIYKQQNEMMFERLVGA